ncbi:alpha/beta fold hydrolase [Streptomyces flaveolus]|uniref:alpha/beta fold hydrolase n=1 Tax=Streptomyces flaveolus TaxID=67297 RepID=UPI0033EF049D
MRHAAGPGRLRPPRAGHLSLALVRRPADDQAHRQGTLLLNDGAGGSSIEQLRLAMRIGFPAFAGAMSRNFDLVAVDPRGVGHSTPIRCTTPLKPAGITHFPRNQQQFDTLVAHNRSFAANCLRENGPLIAHTDLTSTARDFEALRTGLGEKQLNWYGIHYSTLLGRTYADLYPGRLRTMVLDTALDDTTTPAERIRREAATAEEAFNRFTSGVPPRRTAPSTARTPQPSTTPWLPAPTAPRSPPPTAAGP